MPASFGVAAELDGAAELPAPALGSAKSDALPPSGGVDTTGGASGGLGGFSKSNALPPGGLSAGFSVPLGLVTGSAPAFCFRALTSSSNFSMVGGHGSV